MNFGCFLLILDLWPRKLVQENQRVNPFTQVEDYYFVS